MTATTDTPTVVCPSWCTVTEAEHVAELLDQEGHVVHHSDETAGDGWSPHFTSWSTPDGRPGRSRSSACTPPGRCRRRPRRALAEAVRGACEAVNR
jgi:hypothetical protein